MGNIILRRKQVQVLLESFLNGIIDRDGRRLRECQSRGKELRSSDSHEQERQPIFTRTPNSH